MLTGKEPTVPDPTSVDPGYVLTDVLGRPVPVLAHGEPVRQLL